jgi:hypothetical protein
MRHIYVAGSKQLVVSGISGLRFGCSSSPQSLKILLAYLTAEQVVDSTPSS